MSPTFRYLTLAESLREDARRHMARSGAYAAASLHAWSDNSAMKAARKFKLANEFDELGVAI
jgi:hypothetical protein